MSYGFTEAYSRNAQWISSYPVARFVHSGIAVLMMNWAGIGSKKMGRFTKSKRALESAVSLYGNAIAAVTKEGVDVSRAMVMGWSFGGLFAAHAIQVLPNFVAAQVGDPADYNVTAFGLGDDYWRNQSRMVLGGPPSGRFLRHYQFFDPVGDGNAATGPILLEFVSRNPDVGQLLEEWRAAGADVEAFAYRRSVHWLNVPAEARMSRLRNLYWAKLNLLGPDAVTARQLRRVGLTIPLHGWWNGKKRRMIAGPSVAAR
ncbi:MAG: alpha/beta hydrolase family protein [Steroidobacteraceae bacterium]